MVDSGEPRLGHSRRHRGPHHPRVRIQADPSADYAIPAFSHCGLSTVLLNLTIPGSGNTLNLTLGRLRLG